MRGRASAQRMYGFTYAPLTESPVFAKDHYGSFEVHKAADGTERLIGFVSASDVARLRQLPTP